MPQSFFSDVGGSLRAAYRWLLLPLLLAARWVTELFARLGVSVVARAPKVRGVPLAVTTRDRDLYERASRAFELLATHSPERLSALRAGAAVIVVGKLSSPMRGQFKRSTRLLVLDQEFVRATSPERVAQQIVHDLTHALSGVAETPAALLAQERACIEAEVVFATALPNGKALAADARARLQTAREDYEATHEPFPQHPQWLVRVLMALAKPGMPQSGKDAA